MKNVLQHKLLISCAICLIGGCGGTSTSVNAVESVKATVAESTSHSDLDGLWILYSAEDFGVPKLTATGEALKKTYDFTTSDPALKCIPASWTRVYSNPNTPMEFKLKDDELTVRYELFDIKRTVPIVDTPEEVKLGKYNTAYTELGKSVGWFEGDDLVVYTADYGDDIRVLSTIRQWAGLHQSQLMATSERYRRDGDQLKLEITHFDPLMYTEPLVVNYTFDLEPDFEIEEYGCVPGNAAVNSIE